MKTKDSYYTDKTGVKYRVLKKITQEGGFYLYRVLNTHQSKLSIVQEIRKGEPEYDIIKEKALFQLYASKNLGPPEYPTLDYVETNNSFLIFNDYTDYIDINSIKNIQRYTDAIYKATENITEDKLRENVRKQALQASYIAAIVFTEVGNRLYSVQESENDKSKYYWREPTQSYIYSLVNTLRRSYSLVKKMNDGDSSFDFSLISECWNYVKKTVQKYGFKPAEIYNEYPYTITEVKLKKIKFDAKRLHVSITSLEQLIFNNYKIEEKRNILLNILYARRETEEMLDNYIIDVSRDVDILNNIIMGLIGFAKVMYYLNSAMHYCADADTYNMINDIRARIFHYRNNITHQPLFKFYIN